MAIRPQSRRLAASKGVSIVGGSPVRSAGQRLDSHSEENYVFLSVNIVDTTSSSTASAGLHRGGACGGYCFA